MELEATEGIDQYLETQSILLAASNHDLEALRTLLRRVSAKVQDPETKSTPLHAAIAACEGLVDPALSAQNAVSNIEGGVGDENAGHRHADEKSGENSVQESAEESRHDCERDEKQLAAATQVVRLLLENGAIWNDVDVNDETPGCLARRLGLKTLYEIMVDAGVRAEILLNRLDEYEMLKDAEEEEDEEEEKDTDEDIESAGARGDSARDPGIANLQNLNGDNSLGTPEENTANALSQSTYHLKPTNAAYLGSELRIDPDRILDSAQNGVMMAWETSIMERTAKLLAPKPGLRILNIGHGMGIIDGFFQQTSPVEHHIIEAHPSILAHMQEEGKWHEKATVTIHAQKWQEAVPALVAQGVVFDAIYFDTFAEDYKALRDFFSEWVLGLLDDGGRWGFFNGLGADRQICYDVYGKVVEMDLFEAGFDTEWETLQVPHTESTEQEWQGVRRRYWALSEYRLPICTFSS